MGVTGLWRLIEPAGKPVPVETLENKVLAVDISIWLHQMVKGYQDAKGAPLPNAHLMGLFQRLCKLLYFRIKPIFVFDGGFPDLKKETIAKRQDSKAKYQSESERIKRELALILGKKTAVTSLLGKQISPKKSNPASAADVRNDDDIFKLPALPEKGSESESEDEDTSSGSIIDVHSVDIESNNFKTLPAKEKYDLLVELKETRKMNSWGRLHELPKKSDNFSDFQMQRLLKRRKVQECLQETEKEMGDTGMSLNDLESLLNEEGIDTKIDSIPGRRIASNNTTRFLLISNVRQALADAKKKKEAEENPATVSKENTTDEDDLEKAIKMSMECVDDPEAEADKSETFHEPNEANTSASMSKTNDSWTSYVSESDNEDSEEEDGFEEPDNMSSAKAYIMQYSDFTHKSIEKMISRKNKKTTSSNLPKVDQIIEELNNEKSVILDNIDLSSSDDEPIQEKVKIVSNTGKENDAELNMSEDLEAYVDVDATQSSVVCLGNPTQEVISLESSMEEENIYVDHVIDTSDKSKIDNDQKHPEEASDSSNDEEFEEVPELEGKASKPVVEFTLNLAQAPEDDIFADVFCENTKVNNNLTDQMMAGPSNAVLKKEDDIFADVFCENIKADVIDEVMAEPSNVVLKKETYTDTEKYISNRSTSNEAKNRSKHEKLETDIIKTKDGNRITVKEPIKIVEESPTSEIGNENVDKITKTGDEIISKNMKEPSAPISSETLNNMVEELQHQEQDLLQEKGRLDRVGRNITEQMTKEAQELLQIFGIPYIVAPMEAEAQCAFLESVKLTDGTITDDSDIWLFGGRTVYKNFFNQKKHVLQFLAERIERSFNLAREQLILLALLVGSDYTTGVTGVGPVTALEILASFPFNKKQFLNEASKQARCTKVVAGLQEFKQWVRSGKRTDNTTLKKKLRNVEIGDDFPSVRVVQAYLEPNVEKSEEKFTWGELDVTVLRDYTRTKFGWSQNKLDEIINPVLKRLQDRKSQKTVHDYFKRKIEFQCLEEQMSKRVKAAVQKMGPETSLGALSTAEEPNPKPARKGKGNKQKKKEVAGPSNQPKAVEEDVLIDHKVRVVSQFKDGKSGFEITIPKTDRFQEMIPQREKDKKSLLENKMKAIELFRKTKLDRKKKHTKRRPNLPKEKADLSESDSD